MSNKGFVRLFKRLFDDERFQEMSVDAKVLYAFMTDRASLSRANKWKDKNGRVFIYFTITEVCKLLSCAEGKACRMMSEIECLGLIERKKQGQGNPAKIYVLPIDSDF